MWIKMTDQEIQALKKKDLYGRFFSILPIFALCLVGVIIGEMSGASGLGKPHTIGLSLEEMVAEAPLIMLKALIAALVLVLIFSRKSKMTVCPKCDRLKKADKKGICECGGTLYDADLYKWVDKT